MDNRNKNYARSNWWALYFRHPFGKAHLLENMIMSAQKAMMIKPLVKFNKRAFCDETQSAIRQSCLIIQYWYCYKYNTVLLARNQNRGSVTTKTVQLFALVFALTVCPPYCINIGLYHVSLRGSPYPVGADFGWAFHAW